MGEAVIRCVRLLVRKDMDGGLVGLRACPVLGARNAPRKLAWVRFKSNMEITRLELYLYGIASYRGA